MCNVLNTPKVGKRSSATQLYIGRCADAISFSSAHPRRATVICC